MLELALVTKLWFNLNLKIKDLIVLDINLTIRNFCVSLISYFLKIISII